MEISETDLIAHLLDLSAERRILCAVAGAPGSGKTTLARGLVAALNTRVPESAVMVQMDGFHFDDLYLEPAGLRARKGAPETFDVGGLRHMLSRLRAGEEEAVAVPVFDREIEVARAGAQMVPRAARIIVVEGNYLLLARPPWDSLRAFFDVAVRVDVPEAILRARLGARWQGLGLNVDEIAAKVEENDIPNGRLVQNHSQPVDFLLRQDN